MHKDIATSGCPTPDAVAAQLNRAFPEVFPMIQLRSFLTMEGSEVLLVE